MAAPREAVRAGAGLKPAPTMREFFAGGDHLTMAEFAELDDILGEFGRDAAGLTAAAEIMQLPLERLAACAERNPELMRQAVVTVGGEPPPPEPPDRAA